MPIRTYECSKCEEIFEEFENMNDPPKKKCKFCKSTKVMRIVSLPARPVVPGDIMEQFYKTKQEAKQMAQRIVKGDQKAIADIYGEDVAAGKPRKQPEVSKPKAKGVIKRKDK